MKEKGFTLIELMLAMALTGILLSMISPLFRGIMKQQETSSKYDKMDKDLIRTTELIKRVVRGSESDPAGTTTAVDVRSKAAWATSLASSTLGEGVVIRTAGTGTNLTTIYYDDANNNIMVNEGTVADFTGGNILLRNVSSLEFLKNDKSSLLVINIELTIDGTVQNITDAATSRVLLQW